MKLRYSAFITAITLALTIAASAQTKTFTDSKNGFTVAYKSGWKTATGKRAATDTAFGDAGSGSKLFRAMPATFARKYHGSYEFNVWVSSDAKADCGAPSTEPGDGEIPIGPVAEGWAKTMKIGGKTFYGYTASDGGMSKSLDVIGYRGKVGGRCFQIQALSYQVSAFEDFKPFDTKPIAAEFRAFLKTVKFTGR